MRTLAIRPVTSIALFLLFASCSKNSNSTNSPAAHCNIVTASYTTNSDQINYTFTYNSDNKVSKAVVKGKDSTNTYNKTYTYNGKVIYIFTDAGSNSSTDTVTLNDAGMIASEKETTKQGIFVEKYTYNSSTGLLESSTYQQDAYPAQTTTYTFSNGDLTSYVSNGVAITITYDTNKPSLQGNMDEFTQLHYYGALYYKNKHQVSSAQVGSVNVKYTYTTDTDGKITSLVSTYPSAVETMRYTYECK